MTGRGKERKEKERGGGRRDRGTERGKEGRRERESNYLNN